ncbi:MAG: GNAT family N-acetyltransferase [Defluviitaleaceae bacterium]|nr:GNAT family N-acetyltransferase [Defluviitaleaceae bacterium]
MIELRKVTHDNFDDILKLKLPKEQERFVAPNIFTLAEAYKDLINNDKPPMVFAINKDDEVIGLCAMEFNDIDDDEILYEKFGDTTTYNFFRFMIDEKHQRKGYGKQALEKIIDFLKTQPQGKACSITVCYEPDNEVAKKMYFALGFEETECEENGEMIARLAL